MPASIAYQIDEAIDYRYVILFLLLAGSYLRGNRHRAKQQERTDEHYDSADRSAVHSAGLQSLRWRSYTSW